MKSLHLHGKLDRLMDDATKDVLPNDKNRFMRKDITKKDSPDNPYASALQDHVL